MLSKWDSFLRGAGACIENGTVTGFDDQADNISPIDTDCLVDLSIFSLIRVSGKDATAFLHGQFTSNVTSISEEGLQWSSWCNPRGQVLANFLILKTDTGFLLLLPEEMKVLIMKRLQMYILRADVTLHDECESLVLVGITGKDISRQMRSVFAAAASDDGYANLPGGIMQLQIPGITQRYLLIGGVEAMQTAWNMLVPVFKPAGTQVWALLDILAGLPWITTPTSGMFLPQMLNLDSIGGLSYQKGCYPGQEIITRLHKRGQLKRGLYLAKIPDGSEIRPGQDLIRKDEGRSIGTVINIAPELCGGYSMLAVLETVETVPATIALAQHGDLQITPQPLPCRPHA